MRARRRWAIALAAVAAVTLGAREAPLALRHVDGFRVRRVHVEGTRHLSAADAIAASGITTRSSVFDDFEPWREALERHPLVLRVRITRRLPRTIVLGIIESEPIARVRVAGRSDNDGAAARHGDGRNPNTPLPASPRWGEGYVPVDARGRVLPIGADRLDSELPVVNAGIAEDEAGSRVEDAGLGAVRAFARIRQAEPWLAAWTSEIAAAPDGLRLEVRWPAGAEVLLADPEPDVLEAIRLTVLDLATSVMAESDDGAVAPAAPAAAAAVTNDEAPGPALAATELERLDQVDARFRDQVVVTLRATGRAGREERAR